MNLVQLHEKQGILQNCNRFKLIVTETNTKKCFQMHVDWALLLCERQHSTVWWIL